MVSCLRLIRFAMFLLVLTVPALASADLLQSSHFRLDPNVGSSVGGTSSSASYGLQDAGGEAVVGAGSSQSYKLTQGYISHLQNSIQISVVPTGTFTYLPLDTGIGNQVYDVTTTNNQSIAQGTANWVSGQIGQALQLNGSTQYVSTSVNQSNPNPTTQELWFKTTTTSGGLLVGFADTPTGGGATTDRNLYMTNTGQLVYGVHAGSYKTISSTATYNDGNWHHVAATLGTSGLTLVIDGVRVATDASTTAGNTMTGYWHIGYADLTGWPSAPTSHYFAGTVDEIHILDRQLSDAQAKGDYIGGLSGLRFAHVLPTLLAGGTSTTYAADAIIRTDAGGYNLVLQALTPLTHSDTTTTLPMASATVASPGPWVEGTTEGLGFTVTSGTQLESKWGSGPSSYNYAGVPLLPTVYHSRTGVNGGIPEKTTLEYRVASDPNQKSGTYTAVLVYTATMKP
jgi:hypothetical protein